jgi:transporter family protein
VRDVDSDLATAIRTAVILVITWGIVFFKETASSIHSVTKPGFLFLCLSGVATGLSWLFYFKALQIGKVSQVVSVDKLSVALTLILSLVFLHETITLRTALGALFVIIGVLLVISWVAGYTFRVQGRTRLASLPVTRFPVCRFYSTPPHGREIGALEPFATETPGAQSSTRRGVHPAT